MSIATKDLDAAIQEAERFIKCAQVVKDMVNETHGRYETYGVGSKYTAAVKRASMDLTRALVSVRSTK